MQSIQHLNHVSMILYGNELQLTWKNSTICWICRITISENKVTIGVVPEISECFGVFDIIDSSIQSNHNSTDFRIIVKLSLIFGMVVFL